MSDLYRDPRIECSSTGLLIRGYYFPWGTKEVPYGSIRGLSRRELSLFRGQARIWGTANFSLWANLDPGRPKKQVGFVVETGKSIQPFVTPDDPDEFERVLRERANLGPNTSPPEAGPLI